MGEFASVILQFSEETSKKCEAFRKAVVIIAGERAIDTTPVGDPSRWKDRKQAEYAIAHGYKGGHSKGNWQTSVGKAITTEKTDGNKPFPGPLDPDGSAAKAELHNNLGEGDCVVNISNNVPYALRLEYGHSTQTPPSGIVRGIQADWPVIIEQAKRRVGL